MSKPNTLANQASSQPLGRREFLQATAMAGAALAAPSIVPASALGKNGAVAPSERIILGGIGIGGRGSFDLRMLLREPEIQCVAICDPQKDRREKVKREIVDPRYDNEDCKLYSDIAISRHPYRYRRRADYHWRPLACPASIMAMRGKDVYSEKPSSMTIQEGRALLTPQNAMDGSTRREPSA